VYGYISMYMYIFVYIYIYRTAKNCNTLQLTAA